MRDIDTAAIRRDILHDGGAMRADQLELCDALDVARACLEIQSRRGDDHYASALYFKSKWIEALEIGERIADGLRAAEAKLDAVRALSERSLRLPVCGEAHLARLILAALEETS